MQNRITEKLSHFNPVYLEVVNESHNHNVPANSSTHFKVTLVSEQFVGKRAVARHQLVYAILADELKSGVHALALHTYAPDEWQGDSPASPDCMAGNGK